jgi:aryl-alcohol dehydrogenase-like predicted oxidoreductase
MARAITVADVKPGRVAIGTWSGGHYLGFGERVDEDRLIEVLRPGGGIDTVISADTYGQGEADSMLGRALVGVPRDDFSLVGAVGHDFYEGERDGPRGFPRFTDPSLRGPGEYAGYLRMAAERSLERLGAERFDLLMLHNPDRTGYTSEEVWDAMAALREEGLASEIGVAPGPANGFTLDILDCFDRFGERLDWAMLILNPFEPWPGELVLDAAAEAGIDVITRVVDYGGLFWGDVPVDESFGQGDHRRFRPSGWVAKGRERLAEVEPIAAEHGLTTMQLACAWNLAHDAVACVVPTLIQEAGEGARTIEEKRAELAALPEVELSREEIERIREIGDNSGSMALKGASPEHEGDVKPDRWPLSPELVAAGERWGVVPERDLVQLQG